MRRRSRRVPRLVAGSPTLAELGNVVPEAGAGELVCVRIDHRVVQEVFACEICVTVAVGDAAVHIGVHLRVPALAHSIDAPRYERRRQIVEQDAVGDRAREPQHLFVQRGDEDLGAVFTEPHAEPEAFYSIEIALEADRLAAEALANECDELAYLRDRPVGVAGAVPLAGDGRRRDPDTEVHVAISDELLQRRGGHRVQRRRAQLEREHTGAEPEMRRSLADRAEQHHRFGRVRFGDPRRVVPERVGFAHDIERQVGSEGLDPRHAHRVRRHGREPNPRPRPRLDGEARPRSRPACSTVGDFSGPTGLRPAVSGDGDCAARHGARPAWPRTCRRFRPSTTGR